MKLPAKDGLVSEGKPRLKIPVGYRLYVAFLRLKKGRETHFSKIMHTHTPPLPPSPSLLRTSVPEQQDEAEFVPAGYTIFSAVKNWTGEKFVLSKIRFAYSFPFLVSLHQYVNCKIYCIVFNH